MTDEALGQRAAVAYVLAMGIDWAKRSNMIPWISHNTDKLNRAVSVLTSFLQTAGFAFVWEGTMETGGVLKITVPAVAAIIHFGSDWIYAFAVQEFVSKVAIQPRAVEGVPVPPREIGVPAAPPPPPVVVAPAPRADKLP